MPRSDGASSIIHLNEHSQLRRHIPALDQIIRNLEKHFRSAAQGAEMWARNKQKALLYGRAEVGDDPNSYSAIRALVFHINSVVTALSNEVAPLSRELENLPGVLQDAVTKEQALAAASRAWMLFTYLEEIGEGCATQYSTVAELTAAAGEQARMLLELFPHILEAANLMSIPLPRTKQKDVRSSSVTANTSGEGSVDEVVSFMDEVGDTERRARTELGNVLQSPRGEPQYDFLQLLPWKAHEDQNEMRAALEWLTKLHRNTSTGSSAQRSLDTAAALERVQDVKNKELAVSVALRQEAELSVERASEQVAAVPILLPDRAHNQGKESHPLLDLSRMIKQYLAPAVKAVNHWAHCAYQDYPSEFLAQDNDVRAGLPATSTGEALRTSSVTASDAARHVPEA